MTLGHDSITSYADFIQRLIGRFDRKDLELHLRELEQLKQVGSINSYILELQKLSVMVTDVLEHRLIALFMVGLSKPLCGWIKAFDPNTLQDAIKRARNMKSSAPRNKFPPKPFMKKKDKKPFQKEWSKRNTMDDEVQNELCRKGYVSASKSLGNLATVVWERERFITLR